MGIFFFCQSLTLAVKRTEQVHWDLTKVISINLPIYSPYITHMGEGGCKRCNGHRQLLLSGGCYCPKWQQASDKLVDRKHIDQKDVGDGEGVNVDSKTTTERVSEKPRFASIQDGCYGNKNQDSVR